jgi:putative ABC transport system ATP-binding protein
VLCKPRKRGLNSEDVVVILELRNVVMQFKSGDAHINVLDGINFSMTNGEGVALVGQSGTGKSTLLQLVALLE